MADITPEAVLEGFLILGRAALTLQAEAPQAPVAAPRFKAHGPKRRQDEAKALAPLVLQTWREGTGFEFWSYATSKDRAAHAAELVKTHQVLERVWPTQAMAPTLDFDGKGATEEELAEVVDAFEQVARGWGATHARPLVTVSRRPIKLGAHLLADGWRVRGNAEARRFVEEVIAQTREPLRVYIDNYVGKGTYSLRIPGCPKRDPKANRLDHSAVHAPDPDLGSYMWDTEDAGWITGTGVTHQLLGRETRAPGPREEPLFEADGTKLGAFYEHIQTTYAHYALEVLEEPVAGTIARCKRLLPAHCKACGRSHETDGAYVTLNSAGYARLKCFRSGKVLDHRYVGEEIGRAHV